MTNECKPIVPATLVSEIKEQNVEVINQLTGLTAEIKKLNLHLQVTKEYQESQWNILKQTLESLKQQNQTSSTNINLTNRSNCETCCDNVCTDKSWGRILQAQADAYMNSKFLEWLEGQDVCKFPLETSSNKVSNEDSSSSEEVIDNTILEVSVDNSEPMLWDTSQNTTFNYFGLSITASLDTALGTTSKILSFTSLGNYSRVSVSIQNPTKQGDTYIANSYSESQRLLSNVYSIGLNSSHIITLEVRQSEPVIEPEPTIPDVLEPPTVEAIPYHFFAVKGSVEFFDYHIKSNRYSRNYSFYYDADAGYTILHTVSSNPDEVIVYYCIVPKNTVLEVHPKCLATFKQVTDVAPYLFNYSKVDVYECKLHGLADLANRPEFTDLSSIKQIKLPNAIYNFNPKSYFADFSKDYCITQVFDYTSNTRLLSGSDFAVTLKKDDSHAGVTLVGTYKDPITVRLIFPLGIPEDWKNYDTGNSSYTIIGNFIYFKLAFGVEFNLNEDVTVIDKSIQFDVIDTYPLYPHQQPVHININGIIQGGDRRNVPIFDFSNHQKGTFIVNIYGAVLGGTPCSLMSDKDYSMVSINHTHYMPVLRASQNIFAWDTLDGNSAYLDIILHESAQYHSGTTGKWYRFSGKSNYASQSGTIGLFYTAEQESMYVIKQYQHNTGTFGGLESAIEKINSYMTDVVVEEVPYTYTVSQGSTQASAGVRRVFKGNQDITHIIATTRPDTSTTSEGILYEQL